MAVANKVAQEAMSEHLSSKQAGRLSISTSSGTHIGEGTDYFGSLKRNSSMNANKGQSYSQILQGFNLDAWNRDESGGKLNWLDLLNNEQFKNHLKKGEHMKVYRKKKGFKQFRRLILAQELKPDSNAGENAGESGLNGGLGAAGLGNQNQGTSGDHGAVWAIRFSRDGMFMATAGKDTVLRVWKVISSPAERLELNQHSKSFLKSTTKAISELNGQLAQYGLDLENDSLKSESSSTALNSFQSTSMNRGGSFRRNNAQANNTSSVKDGLDDSYAAVFHPSPYRSFREHTDDILDVDWSKNAFILTGSMDKTVKIWHCEREKSLKTFNHPDFVTGVRFHPEDDRFFVSVCLDQKCRLWSILEKEISFEYDCGDLITAMDISYDGKYIILGTFNGYIHVLVTKSLELQFSFNVLDKPSNSDSDGKRKKQKDKKDKKEAMKHGPKITGLEFMQKDDQRIALSEDISQWFMVSSNDSKIRIYNLGRDLISVMKGHSNEHSQISAHSVVSRSGRIYIISGSEDHWIYSWRMNEENISALKDARQGESTRSRSGSLRSFCKRHSAEHDSKFCGIHHALHQTTPNSNYIGFHAHHHPITCAMQVPSQTSKILSLSNDLICELTMQFWETPEDFLLERTGSNIKKPKDRKRTENPTATTAQDHAKSCPFHCNSSNHICQALASPTGALSPKLSSSAAFAATNSTTNSTTNTAALSEQPQMYQFIGGIVVSADTTGLIRVFRSDVSSNIRKKVLKKLDLLESQLNSAADATSHAAATANPPNNGGLSTAPRTRPTSQWFDPDGDGTSACPSSADETSSSNFPSISIDSEPHTRVCNVCGGTRFGLDPSPSTFPQSSKHHCLDCGALYTHFR